MHDDLINALRHCAECDHQGCAQDCRFGKEHPLNFICIEYLQREAADAIEELSRLHEAQRQNLIALMNEEPESQWIPCSERLPEIDEKHHCSKDVLAYLEGGGMCFTALEENIFGQACFECERNPAVEEEMIVTHWMPLPEPPDHIGEANEMVEKESEG